MKVLLVITVLILSGCAVTNGLSVHTFTNANAEAVLKQELPKLGQNLRLLGQPVKFDVNDLSVDIGPNNRDVVILGFDTTASISALMLTYPVNLRLKIEGSPYYDSQKKAVFLRNVNLLDSTIEAGLFKGNLGVLNKEAMTLINQFLDDNPVYTLDMNDPKIALMSKLPLDMKVMQGAIKIVPRLSN